MGTGTGIFRHEAALAAWVSESPEGHLARQALRVLSLELRLLRRLEERVALCPDHRDKLSGRCVACDGERRGRGRS